MIKIYLLISLSIIAGFNVFGQKTEIDIFCVKADSSLISENIIRQSLRHKTDFEAARYFDHYYIDTLKRILIKSIYEFNFEGGEYLEFYYREGEIVKINAKHKFNEREFTGSFYFKSENLIASTDGEISPGQSAFDLKQLLKTGNEHKKYSKEIIDSLKQKSPIQ